MPRHQSLRATLDWSYGLLSPSEQVILRRVAVFDDRFDVPSASAVATDETIRAADVFDTLTSLVTKSLLTLHLSGERALYRLPTTTRTYALEKLHESDEFVRTTQLHEESWRTSEVAA
jgi:predicted ATPase